MHRYWFTFNWQETGGVYYSGWCFGHDEQHAIEGARIEARRWRPHLPNLDTALVWLQPQPAGVWP